MKGDTMPKVFLTETQKDYNRLKENLELLKGNRSCKEMGVIIGSSQWTFQNRMKNPESLTYEEIKRLCDFFKIDIGAFVGRKLKIQ